MRRPSSVPPTRQRRDRAQARSEALATKETNDWLRNTAVVLAGLWLVGLITSYTLGGFIHALILFAVALFLVRVIKGSGEMEPAFAAAASRPKRRRRRVRSGSLAGGESSSSGRGAVDVE
ncbi:MAG: lmo0937 family membrane protein [Deltaproteobacteria bacterium]|nr:lmo0937 family membrane protein [Deltaproteobacteria bacterium]